MHDAISGHHRRALMDKKEEKKTNWQHKIYRTMVDIIDYLFSFTPVFICAFQHVYNSQFHTEFSVIILNLLAWPSMEWDQRRIVQTTQ